MHSSKTFVRGMAVAGVFLTIAATALAVDTFIWVNRQPAVGASIIASDADGSNLIAIKNGGRAYTSSDYGANWTERRPNGDANWGWQSVASDTDGSNLIAGQFTGGRLYTTADGGANWVERQPAGNVDKIWYGVASDADGSVLMAGVAGGRLYTSADSGANWSERQPAGAADKAWKAMDADTDGSNLIVGASGGRLYTSVNGGVNWTERQPGGDADLNWASVASDTDGSHLIAAVGGGRLYTSANGGVNWTERQPAGNVDASWSAVDSSSDGVRLVASVQGGRIYTSNDSGANWTEQRPAGDSDLSWQNVASGADGLFLFAAISAGNSYVGTLDATNPSVSSLSPADDSTGVGRTTNLVLTFDEAVDAETGNITIKKTSDNSTVEAIDVTGGLVTGSGSTTITVNPSVTLDAGTQYYVLVAATAFDDASGNSYAGIASTTAWSFTTQVAGSTGGTTAPPSAPPPTKENPTGETKAVLASGSEVTISRDVSLDVYAGTNVRSMSISENPMFLFADMVSFNPHTTVTLSPDLGNKTVYVRLFASSGQSVMVSDSITLVSPEAKIDEEITKPPFLPPREERVFLPRVELAKILPVATPVDGLVKLANDPSVYYIGLDGKRHPFASGRAFETWFTDWSQVKVVSASDLASVPLGLPVLERPGSRWVKIQSDPKTYFVDPDGYTLRWIQDEEAAKLLGGDLWNKNIVDVEPTYFTKYQVGEPISSASLAASWPKGSLVQASGDTVVWYVTATGRRPITSTAAFNANQFQAKFIRQTPSTAGWLALPIESAITGREDALTSEMFL